MSAETADMRDKLLSAEAKTRALQVEVDDLQATLAEEQWLVQAQKQEIERLRNELASANQAKLDADERGKTAEGQLSALRDEYSASRQKWLEDLRALAEEKREWETERSKLTQPGNGAEPREDGERDSQLEDIDGDQVPNAEETADGWAETAALRASMDKKDDMHMREIEAFCADHEALSEQLSALRLDAEAHTDQIRLLANERERLDKESGDLALQRETLLRDMEGMERTIYDLRTNLGEEQRTSQSYQTQLEEAREHLEKVEADNARLRAGLEETAGLLAAQKDESREHEAEWQVLKVDFESKYADLEKLWKDTEGKLEKALGELEKAQKDNRSTLTELCEARARADEFAAKWSASCVDLSRAEGDANDLKAQHAAMYRETEDMRAQYKLMQAEVEERECESVSLKVQAARLMESLDAANLVNTELCEKLKELQVRRSSQPPSRYWQADHDAPSCNGCSGSFSLTNRRHHCRLCGLVFCAACTGHRIHVLATKNPVRVCGPCHDQLAGPDAHGSP